jgi:hypothetical protein
MPKTVATLIQVLEKQITRLQEAIAPHYRTSFRLHTLITKAI